MSHFNLKGAPGTNVDFPSYVICRFCTPFSYSLRKSCIVYTTQFSFDFFSSSGILSITTRALESPYLRLTMSSASGFLRADVVVAAEERARGRRNHANEQGLMMYAMRRTTLTNRGLTQIAADGLRFHEGVPAVTRASSRRNDGVVLFVVLLVVAALFSAVASARTARGG